MNIKNIKLLNFRSYTEVNINFNKGINILYGDNASGKTNLVEAIYYFAFSKSFRTNDDKNLIKTNSDNFYLKGSFERFGYDNNIEIFLSKKGKRIMVNDKKINKLSELNKYLNIVYFIPNDVNILKNPPKERRNYLDMVISKVDKSYFNKIIEYNKILKEKNSLLKSEVIDRSLLDILNKKISEKNMSIYKIRKEFMSRINNILPDVFSKLFLKKINAEMKYKSLINNFKNDDNLYMFLKKHEDEEIKYKVSLYGIQKDDFLLFIDGKDIGKYGSQGENRLSAISLKMVNYFLTEGDDKPIIILDDVLSELDKNHEESLLKFLKELEQVFITSTKKINIENVHYYKIENSTVIEEV